MTRGVCGEIRGQKHNHVRRARKAGGSFEVYEAWKRQRGSFGMHQPITGIVAFNVSSSAFQDELRRSNATDSWRVSRCRMVKRSFPCSMMQSPPRSNQQSVSVTSIPSAPQTCVMGEGRGLVWVDIGLDRRQNTVSLSPDVHQFLQIPSNELHAISSYSNLLFLMCSKIGCMSVGICLIALTIFSSYTFSLIQRNCYDNMS